LSSDSQSGSYDSTSLSSGSGRLSTTGSEEPGRLDSGLVNQASSVEKSEYAPSSTSGGYDAVRQVSAEELSRGVVFSTEGETWNDLARRLFGDESRAKEIWKANRDRYPGGFESRLVAGKLVRIPDARKNGIISNDNSRMASK
jgi:nucleoid-associated protein YgaU